MKLKMNCLMPLFLFTVVFLGLFSCSKDKASERVNPYDQHYEGLRNYNLMYSHTTVFDPSGNNNGILEPSENGVELHIYFTNNGPDPVLMKEAELEVVSSSNAPDPAGIFLKKYPLGNARFENIFYGSNYDGIYMGESEELGYEVNYIAPSTTDYIKLQIDALSTLANSVDFKLILTDWDKTIKTVDWSYETH